MTGWNQALAGRRVLIVDDHRVLAEALATALMTQGGVAEAEVAWSLAQARALLHSQPPDLVLIDLHLGEESGLDLLDSVRPETVVAIVSGGAPAEAIGSAFERGARAWIVKDGGTEELLAGLAAAMAGRLYLSSSAVATATAALVGYGGASDRPPLTGFAATVSTRELDVLECVLAGLDREGIAHELGISPNTVRTHLQRLFRAADVHSVLALQAAARGGGVRARTAEPALH